MSAITPEVPELRFIPWNSVSRDLVVCSSSAILSGKPIIEVGDLCSYMVEHSIERQKKITTKSMK